MAVYSCNILLPLVPRHPFGATKKKWNSFTKLPTLTKPFHKWSFNPLSKTCFITFENSVQTVNSLMDRNFLRPYFQQQWSGIQASPTIPTRGSILNITVRLSTCPFSVCPSASQSVSPSKSPPVSQPVSPPVSQSVSQSVSPPVSRSASQSVSKSVSQSASQLVS